MYVNLCVELKYVEISNQKVLIREMSVQLFKKNISVCRFIFRA